MVQVIWTSEATERLASIRLYIRQFDPRASARIADRLFEAGNSLAKFPNRGRPAADGCRALSVVRPYVIVYEVAGDGVRILTILHGAQIAERN